MAERGYILCPAPVVTIELLSIFSAFEAQAIAALRNLGLTDVRASDLHRLYRYDVFEDEIHIMADVRSYFHVTHKVRTPSLLFYVRC